MTTTDQRFPTFFISHGGGPWPWIKDQMPGDLSRLEDSLRELPDEMGATPKAILAVSGHWEERDFTVNTGAAPPMYFDYYGFPDFTYELSYPAPGSPEVAARVMELLGAAGIAVGEDAERGFDHGVFVPLFVAYPNAEVPVVQLSIRNDLDPEAHIAAGRALAPLRDEGVAIVGSGLSYHNMSGFGSPGGAQASREFDEWLTDTLAEVSPEERTERLLEWDRAPSARGAHPREDHLIPLLVAVGAAEGNEGTRTYHQDDFFGTITASSFRFGATVRAGAAA